MSELVSEFIDCLSVAVPGIGLVGYIRLRSASASIDDIVCVAFRDLMCRQTFVFGELRQGWAGRGILISIIVRLRHVTGIASASSLASNSGLAMDPKS